MFRISFRSRIYIKFKRVLKKEFFCWPVLQLTSFYQFSFLPKCHAFMLINPGVCLSSVQRFISAFLAFFILLFCILKIDRTKQGRTSLNYVRKLCQFILYGERWQFLHGKVCSKHLSFLDLLQKNSSKLKGAHETISRWRCMFIHSLCWKVYIPLRFIFK